MTDGPLQQILDRHRDMNRREQKERRAYSQAIHFAVMSPALAERCILAGSRPGDTILDPFGGAGTTAVAANRNGRKSILIELNPAYEALVRQRLAVDALERDIGREIPSQHPTPRARPCVTIPPENRAAPDA